MPGLQRTLAWTLPALLTFLLGACAPRPVAPPAAPLAPVDATELLQRVEKGNNVDTLRGLAKVRLTSQERTVSLSEVLLAGYPDRLRVETLSPFGSPLLILASDGRELQVLLPGEGRFLQGRASADNLRRFTRLPLRLPDLVGLLLYRPPLFPWQEKRASAGSDRYRLFLDGPGSRRQVFSFDPGLQLIGAAYYDGDQLLLEVSYGDFGGASPLFPHRAELQLPAYAVAASLHFQDFTLNAELPAERFRLQPPAGATVEELDQDEKP